MYVKVVTLIPFPNAAPGDAFQWVSQSIYECQTYHVTGELVEIVVREGSITTSVILERHARRLEVYAMNAAGETFDKMSLDVPEN